MMDGRTISEVTALLEDRLGIAVASPHEDLFDSGALDSLAFVNLIVELETAFGIPIALEALDFDDFSTVAGIARFVDGAHGARVARTG